MGILLLETMSLFQTVLGQNGIPLRGVEKTIKEVLEGGRAQRRIVGRNSVYIRWKRGELITEVYIDKYDSVTTAKQEYEGANELLDEALNGRGQKDALGGVGDEAVVYSKIGRPGESSISFRKSEYRVHIGSLPLVQAIKLAKSIDTLIGLQDLEQVILKNRPTASEPGRFTTTRGT
jgi:hypothetical protein